VNLPILLTSAVHVSADQTALTAPDARATAVLESIKVWAELIRVGQIVICDGSGYDFTQLIENISVEYPSVKFECLAFQNDGEKVRRQGKGFGEGQIINHALHHSKLLRKAESFAKCTGKLWVQNFIRCRAGFNGVAGFQMSGKLRVHYVDTRFYIVSRGFYDDVLSDAYMTVDDANGYYLEHAFAEKMSHLRSNQISICPAPAIRGLSGSSGQVYNSSLWQNLKGNVKALSYRLVPRVLGTGE